MLPWIASKPLEGILCESRSMSHMVSDFVAGISVNGSFRVFSSCWKHVWDVPVAVYVLATTVTKWHLTMASAQMLGLFRGIVLDLIRLSSMGHDTWCSEIVQVWILSGEGSGGRRGFHIGRHEACVDCVFEPSGCNFRGTGVRIANCTQALHVKAMLACAHQDQDAHIGVFNLNGCKGCK